MNLSLVCLILAFICFILDSMGGVPTGRVRLLPLGLAFFVLSYLVTGTLRSP